MQKEDVIENSKDILAECINKLDNLWSEHCLSDRIPQYAYIILSIRSTISSILLNMNNFSAATNNCENPFNIILMNNYKIYLKYIENISSIMNQFNRNWTEQSKTDVATLNEFMNITADFIKSNKTENLS